jgi:hypothetical protein
MYIGFYISLFPSFLCFGFFIVHRLFANLIQDVSDSSLQSFFYEAAYGAASMIINSKEALEAGVVNSPTPKQILCPHSPPTTQGRQACTQL